MDVDFWVETWGENTDGTLSKTVLEKVSKTQAGIEPTTSRLCVKCSPVWATGAHVLPAITCPGDCILPGDPIAELSRLAPETWRFLASYKTRESINSHLLLDRVMDEKSSTHLLPWNGNSLGVSWSSTVKCTTRKPQSLWYSGPTSGKMLAM